MYGVNTFKILSLFSIFTGLGLLMSGTQTMYKSGYRPPETPSGWILGIFWIGLGGVIAWTWSLYMFSALYIQKCNHRKRWPLVQVFSSFTFLAAALSFALFGVWITWKYPYKLGPCDCTEAQWGPQCAPCTCDLSHGVCDWGVYGTGTCICDPQWGGPDCAICSERWKPEPTSASAVACNRCKTGYTGVNCEECVKGYSGDDCSVCDNGWQPWTHKSALFPNSIAADDQRHLCDECLPNHFGYYCTRCPYGNDVPLVTLTQNNKLTTGTRVKTIDGKYGTIFQIDNYKSTDTDVLTKTTLTIQLEETSQQVQKKLKDIASVKCNNRGTCHDDAAQEFEGRQLKNSGFCSDKGKEKSECEIAGAKWFKDKYPWEAICTGTSQCSSHLDCQRSENCRGKCTGIDQPVDETWYSNFNGNICEKDEDCQDSGNYNGGRCLNTVCCEESWHGSGNCNCDPSFFGELLGDNRLEHYQQSPACDFCPGYDWITGKQNTICSGNKGTCSVSSGGISLTGKGGEYINMRCDCGEQVYVDPITKITYPDKIIAWSGDLCECGDWNDDLQCDICSDGFWGADCKTCPGGPGKNQCSGHGKCNGGVEGDGHCNCDVSEDNAWMLAPFVERYTGEPVYFNKAENSNTCTECAPQYWGDTCQKCNGMEIGDGGGRLPLTQLQDVFQPFGSLTMNQSPLKPQSICNRGFCYIACSGGGWCNWGRKGDGTCSCWSNSVLSENTWNPLDNVCIGSERSDTNNETGTEACNSYGRCSESDNARTTGDTCGGDAQWTVSSKKTDSISWNRNPYISNSNLWSPYDDWKKQGNGNDEYDYDKECTDKAKGICHKWQPISWTFKNSLRTCTKQ